MDRDEGELLPKKADQQRLETDYEMFLRDVEEDPELRSTVALYKAKQHQKTQDAMHGIESMSIGDTEESEDEEVPRINMDELLDDFDELNVQDEG